MKNMKTKNLVLCALFASLNALLSQISIPIGPVPINLTHISTFAAAGLLGAKYGALSQIVFVLMGAVGLPVFSGFMGGIGRILGPTGGYIIAYAVCAYTAGWIMERFGKSVKVMIAAMYTGWILTYAIGTLWYVYITHTNFITALTLCVIPFLLGDGLKTVLSMALIKRLNPVVSCGNMKTEQEKISAQRIHLRKGTKHEL
ncbi:biotin transporter BioY [Clostridium sp. Marseille-P2415]|uniref:biotin transporter BioY n=1 Tax=Clostridium sp. Marseille-P2415 TaxID=1805471 RepID=UPI0009882E50|nr:biotin transporter BioY [Clostridium sp. Marseille-P2415]